MKHHDVPTAAAVSISLGAAALIASAMGCGAGAEGPRLDRAPLAIEGGPTLDLAAGAVGEDYEATVRATGGAQRRLTWTVIDADNVPAGLYATTTLNPLQLSGRPRVDGEFSFRVQVVDAAGAVAEATVRIEVEPGPPPLEVLTESIPNAFVGEPFASFSFDATGGSGTGYVFFAELDSLPPGLVLDGTGVLSGTPSREGIFPFVVRVRDSVGNVGERPLVMEVLDSCLRLFQIQTERCPDGQVDEPYTCEIGMTGCALPFDLTVGSGSSLPPGLEVIPPGPMSQTGFVRGVPTVPGRYAFQLRGSDDERGIDRQSFFMEIFEADPALRITGRILYPDRPDDSGEPSEAFGFVGYEVGQQVVAEVQARGGSGSGYAWEIVSGQLPEVCSFQSGTPNATLDCTPTLSGTYAFTLAVTDDEGERSPARPFELVVEPATLPLEIVTATGPNATELPVASRDQSYAAEIEGTGGDVPYGWVVQPRDGLPPGLSIDAVGAPSTTLRGVPTSTGTWDFNIRVLDAENRTTTAAFRLTVEP
jgi:hypothetical protein